MDPSHTVPIEPMTDSVADRVNALRKALGLTQEKVAEAAGEPWTRPYVAKIERGDNQVSTVEARARLAKGLGIDVSLLSACLDGKLTPAETVLRARSTKRVYEPGENRAIPPTAIGHHPDWARAKAEAIDRYGRLLDPDVLDLAEGASLGAVYERLTPEVVKSIHDAIEAAEAEKRRRTK